MGVETILIAAGIVGLLMSLFWILSRPPRGSVVREEYY